MHPQTVYLLNYAHCPLSAASAILQTDETMFWGQSGGECEVARNSVANSAPNDYEFGRKHNSTKFQLTRCSQTECSTCSRLCNLQPYY